MIKNVCVGIILVLCAGTANQAVAEYACARDDNAYAVVGSSESRQVCSVRCGDLKGKKVKVVYTSACGDQSNPVKTADLYATEAEAKKAAGHGSGWKSAATGASVLGAIGKAASSKSSSGKNTDDNDRRNNARN